MTRLLIRLPNWVGDACMALPALCALAERGAALHLVGKGWANDLFAGHGWPVLPVSGRLRTDAAAIRATGIRDGLLLTNSLSSAIAFRLGLVRALGHAHEGRSLLLGRAIAQPTAVHEVEAFWRLAREFAAWRGLAPLAVKPPPRLGLVMSSDHCAAAQAALGAAGVTAGSTFVVLAPLAAGTVAGKSKVWPQFAQLSEALARREIVSVCCPGPGEEAAALAATPGSVQLPGLSLGAYAAVCRQAALVVANDSGPMHLAAAVDAPVLGLFGGGEPHRTRPWHPGGRWLGGAQGWPSVDSVLQSAVGAIRSPQ